MPETLSCGCVPHKVRMTDHWGLYCDTEQQPYCNFECPHEDEAETLAQAIEREIAQGKIRVLETAPCGDAVYEAVTDTGSMLDPGELMTVHRHATCTGHQGMCSYCGAFCFVTPNRSDNASICGRCADTL